MPTLEPMNDEMFSVTMFDSDGLSSKETTLFVTDHRKMANEVVDALNDLDADEWNNIDLREIEDEWIRQFLFGIGYKNTIPTEHGYPFFSYDPVTFATRKEVETEEERQEREEREKMFSDAIDKALEGGDSAEIEEHVRAQNPDAQGVKVVDGEGNEQEIRFSNYSDDDDSEDEEAQTS